MKRGAHLLRSERWAWLSYQDGSAELYDMRNDPRQFTNLVDQPAHAEVVGQMRRRLQPDSIGLVMPVNAAEAWLMKIIWASGETLKMSPRPRRRTRSPLR